MHRHRAYARRPDQPDRAKIIAPSGLMARKRSERECRQVRHATKLVNARRLSCLLKDSSQPLDGYPEGTGLKGSRKRYFKGSEILIVE